MLKLNYTDVIDHQDKPTCSTFDFLINHKEFNFDNSQEDLILRFHVFESHVHGFDDMCPNKYESVYKTYLSYDIVEQRTDCNGKKDMSIVFAVECDECSPLFLVQGRLYEMLKEDSNKKKRINLYPCGYGGEWEIERELDSFAHKNIYRFKIFKTADNTGYRFSIYENKADELQEKIVLFLKETLANSEPI